MFFVTGNPIQNGALIDLGQVKPKRYLFYPNEMMGEYLLILEKLEDTKYPF